MAGDAGSREWRSPGSLRQRVRGLSRKLNRALLANPLSERVITRLFQRLYYYTGDRTWQDTRWLGAPLLKCPTDLWIYQELLFELRPDVIVETGTRFGGSAAYFASLCDLLDHGRIVSVDLEDVPGRPEHARIRYLLGSSTAPEVVEAVKAEIREGERVMVVLDSDHTRDHVAGELLAYADLVTPGSYLVVEDTCVNGNAIDIFHGPGPMEAMRDFLARDDRFEIDRAREKFYLSFNPSGFLRRR